MDPQIDLPDLVEDLEVNIDELTTTLAPLLPPSTLSKTASSLPLLEKSKLHVLAAYAIESVLFSTLQASGADAKSHAIFAELARLKSYFSKIKDAEDHFKNLAEKEGRARLDVGAAQRFIKHGLSGNERYDEMRKERVAREKERALEKARALTTRKFDEESEGTKKRGAGEVEGEEGTPNKKRKEEIAEDEEEEEEEEAEEAEQEEADTSIPAPKQRGRSKKPQSATDEAEPLTTDLSIETPQPAKKKRGRPSKKDKAAEATPTRATRSSAPKTRSEAFQALASESPAASKPKAKGKGKGKK
jgi:exosome complex protein LRP1